MFTLDSLTKNNLSYNFNGALMSDEYKLYYYNQTTMSEKLIIDLDKRFAECYENLFVSRFSKLPLGNINGNRLNNFVSKFGSFF